MLQTPYEVHSMTMLGYPLLYVPLVELRSKRNVRGWTRARLPREPRRHLRVDMSQLYTQQVPLSGRDTVFRRAALMVQIALYAQDPCQIPKDATHIVTAHERFRIALTPRGHVYYHPYF
jgi:hypothetical protein